MVFSGLVALQVDALNRPTKLEAMGPGDVIYSGTLPENAKEVISKVEAASAVWDSHTGASAAGFENWNETSATLNAFSGNMQLSTVGLSSLVDGLSSYVDALEVSTTNLSALVEASANAIDASTATLNALVPSAAGFAKWNTSGAAAIYVGIPAGSAISISGAGGDTIDAIKDRYILQIDQATGKARWGPPPFILGGDLQTITLDDDAASDSTISIGGATMLIRDIKVGGNLSAHGDADVQFDPASITVSTCPVPAPVCYAQMDGDGTAGATEIKFGAGVTPATLTDSTGHITWDNTNKEFDISVAGTYHVLATLVLDIDATTLPTIRIKNGGTAKNTYAAHGVHSAEKPEEVTIQAAFPCAASDSLTVTFQDDAATDINLVAGSSVIVRRLF